ncbi:MAG: hypothetical protein BGO31_00635 [Bacteroidetes bacterium 43-16]|nr:MAG: hypothetical protein BGO31_00635 [Bacteroidetes bacterium 43-16]
MKKALLYVAFITGSFYLISCEKEVNFNLPASISEKVVVEGGIELGTPPLVLLTNSFGFFSKLDLSTLQNAFISGAQISVSDGSRTVNLREYSIDTLGNFYKFYSVDSSNAADLTFIGQAGKSYQLKIVVDGKTYESTTTIPQPVSAAFDSIWSEPFENPDPEHPEYRRVMVRYNDPPELGNRFRIFIQQNNRPFTAGRFSTLDDNITNGTTTTLDFYNVLSPMDTSTQDGRFAFLPDDVVTIKFSAIDKATYDFWQTLDFSVGTTGNPFSTPVKVPSNISNGALGIWAGYAPTYKTVTVKE